MIYDLRRLRLKDLVVKVQKSHAYTLTPEGTRFARIFTKCYGHLFRPLLIADRPRSSLEQQSAFRSIEHAVERCAALTYLERAERKLASKFKKGETEEL